MRFEDAARLYMDDKRARLSLIAPQAIQTGYTSECRISYAF